MLTMLHVLIVFNPKVLALGMKRVSMSPRHFAPRRVPPPPARFGTSDFVPVYLIRIDMHGHERAWRGVV